MLILQVSVKLGQLTSMPVKSINLAKELRSLVMALNNHLGDKARYRQSETYQSLHHHLFSFSVCVCVCEMSHQQSRVFGWGADTSNAAAVTSSVQLVYQH